MEHHVGSISCPSKIAHFELLSSAHTLAESWTSAQEEFFMDIGIGKSISRNGDNIGKYDKTHKVCH